MFTLINRLRQKPETQRRAIALWTALLVTLGVFVLWLVYFFVRLGSTPVAAPKQGAEEVSPIQSLTELVSSFFSGLKERL